MGREYQYTTTAGHAPTPDERQAGAYLPRPGDFYSEYESGELAWVVSVWDFRDDPEDSKYYPIRVEYKFGDEERGYTNYLKLSDFLEQFAPAPNAVNAIEAEVNSAAAEIGTEQRRVIALGSSLQALGAGDESGAAPLALTNDQGLAHAAELKRKVAEVRNETAKVSKALKAKTERTQLLIRKQTKAMEARIEAETAALEARMKGMTAALEEQMAVLAEQMKTAQETIWTINLYLGKNETVVQLRSGKPAPSETPIGLRQRRLFMDEESAINADEGGIDFKSIEQFDAWVLQPANMQQVLPEQKGVVAIKVRRDPVNYGDPHANAVLNELNKHTYFLMRNGTNVYRIDTDLEVNDVLFPREDEFVELFEKTQYDRDTGDHVRVKMEPGSEEYMKALKAVGATERHYLRIFLFLQGLLDRTPIFHSRPEDANRRINVFDMLRQDDHVQFIRDAEEKRLLGHTRPSFSEWLDDINSKLQVGCRVSGFWKAYYREHEERRVHPPQADSPDNDAIHTIARTEKGGMYRKKGEEAFVFLFERNDTVRKVDKRFGGYTYGPAETRATYKLYADDRDFINIDAATVEDMEFYLTSRTERHAYKNMFPVLKRAIALKREEAAAEAPFREALVGGLMREYGADEATARAAIEELVSWWKLKNHTHRALLDDDQKASRMILREYGLRLKREKERGTIQHDALVGAILAAPQPENAPEPLYIGHKAGREFVVLRPMNDENIFVAEETWVVGKGGPECVEESHWVGIDTRRERWQQLYVTARFEAMLKDVRFEQYLTEPEEEAVIRRAWERIEERFGKSQGKVTTHREYFRSERPKKSESVYRRVAVVRATKDRELQLWAQVSAPVIPDRLLTEGISSPELKRFDIEWERGKDGKIVVRDDGGGTYTGGEWQFGGANDSRGVVLWQDDTAIAKLAADRTAVTKTSKHRERLVKLQSALYEQVRAEMEKRRHDALLAEFLADHGDMELWEDHLTELKLPALESEAFKKYVPFLVEELAGLMDGLTVKDAVQTGHGRYAELHDADHREQKKTTNFGGDESLWLHKPLVLEDYLPLDLVLRVPEDWAADLKLKTPAAIPDDDDEVEEQVYDNAIMHPDED